MSDTIESLRRQRAKGEENLRLIQERESEYVQVTDAVQMRIPVKSSTSSDDAVHPSERSDASMNIIPSNGRHGQGRVDLAT
jgi:hypothetical protein